MRQRQAHPRWHDSARLVGECVAFVLVVFLVVAAASLAPA